MARDTKSFRWILAGFAIVGLLHGSLAQARSGPSPLKQHVTNWAAKAHMMERPTIGAFARQVRQIDKTGYVLRTNPNRDRVQAMTVASGAGKKPFTRRTIGSEPWFSIAAAGHLLSATTTTKDNKQRFVRETLGDGEITKYKHTFKVGSQLARKLRSIAVEQLASDLSKKDLPRQDLERMVAGRIKPGSDVTYTYQKRDSRFHPVQASVGGLNWINLPSP